MRFQNATPLMVTIGCACNIQRCLGKKRATNESDADGISETEEFSGFASFAEHHTEGTHERHTKFWLGNIMERLISTKHKNNVTLILDTLPRQQTRKMVRAVQHRFIRISQRCPHSSPTIHCGPQTWNFFSKNNNLIFFSFPFLLNDTPTSHFLR